MNNYGTKGISLFSKRHPFTQSSCVSALQLRPKLPRGMVRVRQMVAVSRFITMSLVDFESVGRGRNVSVSKTHRSVGNPVE